MHLHISECPLMPALMPSIYCFWSDGLLNASLQIAVSFRDTALFRCFQTALAALQEMPAKGADNKLKEQASTAMSSAKTQGWL